MSWARQGQKRRATTIPDATQSEIENTSYDSLSSHKISDNVSLDVVVNDSTHKQVFIIIKKPKCGYQVIVSKNDDGSSSVRPL